MSTLQQQLFLLLLLLLCKLLAVAAVPNDFLCKLIQHYCSSNSAGDSATPGPVIFCLAPIMSSTDGGGELIIHAELYHHTAKGSKMLRLWIRTLVAVLSTITKTAADLTALWCVLFSFLVSFVFTLHPASLSFLHSCADGTRV
jgi:hypothetical protein